jgi:hypothetical protein
MLHSWGHLHLLNALHELQENVNSLAYYMHTSMQKAAAAAVAAAAAAATLAKPTSTATALHQQTNGNYTHTARTPKASAAARPTSLGLHASL